jgi:hypothetical protein
MNYFRQYPWFSAAVLFLGLVLAAEIGGLYERRDAARRAELQLERKRRELEKLSATVPGPTAENAAAVAADLAQVEKRLSATEAQLGGSDWPAEESSAPSSPEKRTDLFFALADFVERFRGRLTALGIGLDAGERFGFSAYANAGPEPELIPAVQRQHLVVEYLLGALLVARPHRLLAVERERPQALTGRNAAVAESATSREPVARDLFTIDPTVSARVNGLVGTDAFRLVFVGQTAVLRTFLKQLARFEFPILVRAIEVEPAVLAEGSPAQRSSESMTPVATASVTTAPTIEPPRPLVRSALSKFTVTVELIELAPARPTS